MKDSTLPVRRLPCAAGNVDRVEVGAELLLIEGWIFLPGSPFDEVHVHWENELLGKAETRHRPDVAAVHPWVPHAGGSGFFLECPRPRESGSRLCEIRIVGRREGKSCAELSTPAPLQGSDPGPLPPPELIEKVGSPDERAYRAQGLKLFHDLLRALGRHTSLETIRSMLDWGCGCARVAVHFLRLPEGPKVFGCDVVVESIQWCQHNLPQGRFSVIDFFPPTQYQEGQFDLIIGCSVLTHLTEDMQRRWLAEIRRILAPGGWLLASTLGEHAFRAVVEGDLSRPGFWRRASSPETRRRDQVLKAWNERGFVDERENRSLEGSLPRGLYRNVYQTRQATERICSETFEVAEHIELGMGSYQDLAVLRRR